MTIRRIEAGPRMTQAVVHGNTVYLAGQVGAGNTVADQTADILANVDRLLRRPAPTSRSCCRPSSGWRHEGLCRDELGLGQAGSIRRTRRPAPPAKPSWQGRSTRSRSSSPRLFEAPRTGRRAPVRTARLARRKPCHQRVAVAGIGERDHRHRLVGAPGAPLDDKARAARGDVERCRRVRRRPPSRGSCARPRSRERGRAAMARARFRQSSRFAASGHCRQADQPLLQAERLFPREMAAGQLDHAACERNIETPPIGSRRAADRARDNS